jgi:hypothetical protein
MPRFTRFRSVSIRLKANSHVWNLETNDELLTIAHRGLLRILATTNRRPLSDVRIRASPF